MRFSPEGVNINKLIGNKNISHIKESNKLEKYYNNANFLFPSYRRYAYSSNGSICL